MAQIIFDVVISILLLVGVPASLVFMHKNLQGKLDRVIQKVSHQTVDHVSSVWQGKVERMLEGIQVEITGLKTQISSLENENIALKQENFGLVRRVSQLENEVFQKDMMLRQVNSNQLNGKVFRLDSKKRDK